MINQRMITVVVGAIVLHLAMGIGFMMCRNGGQTKHDNNVASFRGQWEREDGKRESAQEEELLSNFGADQFDRMAYDPRMGIEIVLEKMFMAATPETYSVKVSCDRFSEFTVLIHTFNQPPSHTMAGQLKTVFSRIDPALVYQVIFTDEQSYAIIDRTDLVKVRNWKKASVDEITRKCF